MSSINPYAVGGPAHYTSMGPTNTPGGFSGQSFGTPGLPNGFGFPSYGDPLFYFMPAASSFFINRLLGFANGSAVNINVGPTPSHLGMGDLLLGLPFYRDSGAPSVPGFDNPNGTTFTNPASGWGTNTGPQGSPYLSNTPSSYPQGPLGSAPIPGSMGTNPQTPVPWVPVRPPVVLTPIILPPLLIHPPHCGTTPPTESKPPEKSPWADLALVLALCGGGKHKPKPKPSVLDTPSGSSGGSSGTPSTPAPTPGTSTPPATETPTPAPTPAPEPAPTPPPAPPAPTPTPPPPPAPEPPPAPPTPPAPPPSVQPVVAPPTPPAPPPSVPPVAVPPTQPAPPPAPPEPPAPPVVSEPPAPPAPTETEAALMFRQIANLDWSADLNTRSKAGVHQTTANNIKTFFGDNLANLKDKSNGNWTLELFDNKAQELKTFTYANFLKGAEYFDTASKTWKALQEKAKTASSLANLNVFNIARNTAALRAGATASTTTLSTASQHLANAPQIRYVDSASNQIYNIGNRYFGHASPIVLDSDSNGKIDLTSLEDGVQFDIDGDGQKEQVSWTEAKGDKTDGWLTLDRNGNGQVDNGKELFGPQHGADNGFDELHKFDDNQDGLIDQQDAVYQDLKIWKDTNHDGVSQAQEMVTLDKAGIQNVKLGYAESSDKDQFGNQLRQQGAFTWTDTKATEIAKTQGTTLESAKKGLAVDAWVNTLKQT